MTEIINLMSDTVTYPTEEMYDAMRKAELGDDVYGGDPTVAKLQKLTAEMLGMEDSLFVPSGTMGNLIALMCHCPAGKEVFVETTSHINALEGGSIARIAGLMPNQIMGKNGIFDPDDLRAAIRHKDIHFPPPGMICIENTHNLGGGTVYPIEYLKEFKKISDENNLKLHMDGARVFNAAVYQEADVKEIVKYSDSVMFCLSKGLSAPVGSMIAGSKEFITEAVAIRKMLGGGMRQAGILAAAGIVALNQMTDRLIDDHKSAKRLAEGFSGIPGISVNLESVQTNIVFLKFDGDKDAFYFGKELKEKYNIICGVRNATTVRMVTNRHISDRHVDCVIESACKVMA